MDDRTLTMNRLFDAPLQLVWDAWIRPEHIANWWGPEGMNTQIIEHNFAPGGKWAYSMDMPNGSKFMSEGVFSEIEELHKVVTSADFKPMTEAVILHAIFEDRDGKTAFTFHVVHPTAAYCQQQKDMGFEKGWGSTFKRLEDLLGKLSA